MVKQETLEEVAERYVNSFEFGIAHPRRVCKNAFINGAKWQQQISYSEEEVRIIIQMAQETILSDLRYEDREPRYSEDGIIEQFKKK